MSELEKTFEIDFIMNFLELFTLSRFLSAFVKEREFTAL